MENCLFCKIINGESKVYKVFENENCIAFLDRAPIAQGHLLVIPKLHVADILDMDTDLYTSFWKSVKVVSKSLKTAMQSRRVGIAVEGFTIPHAHIHLVPVNHANDLDPNKAIRGSEEDLVATWNKLGRFFSASKF